MPNLAATNICSKMHMLIKAAGARILHRLPAVTFERRLNSSTAFWGSIGLLSSPAVEGQLLLLSQLLKLFPVYYAEHAP